MSRGQCEGGTTLSLCLCKGNKSSQRGHCVTESLCQFLGMPSLIGWPKKSEIYSLTVLRARSLKLTGLQGHVPSTGSRKGYFLASL